MSTVLLRHTLLFIIISALLAGCSGKGERIAEETKTVPVINPFRIDTVYQHDYVADIQSRHHVEVRARVKGYIEKVFTDEGLYVKQGQVLFRISSQEYQEDLLKARASLKSAVAEAKAAELDLANVRTLVEKNVISSTEMEIAKAKVDAIHAKVEEASSHEKSAALRVAHTEVRAPFSGYIDRIQYKTGSLVDEGTVLTTLSDNSEVFAYFFVSEREYLDFAAAVKHDVRRKDVELLLADNSVHPHMGVIETIEGEFDKNTGSIAFRARFPNPDKILKHGASGKVRLKQDLHNALVIPQKATFEVQDRIYVYTVDSTSKAVIRSFVPRLRVHHLYVVGGGLSEKDRVIYEGFQDLKEGMEVKTRPVQRREVMKKL